MKARLLLLIAHVVAVTSCKTDLDCSLNGDCLPSGKCGCDAAWKGTQCQEFYALPADSAHDLKEANVTTWGGGTLAHSVDGEYHMFVAEMIGACGITAWQYNSQVRLSSCCA